MGNSGSILHKRKCICNSGNVIEYEKLIKDIKLRHEDEDVFLFMSTDKLFEKYKIEDVYKKYFVYNSIRAGLPTMTFYACKSCIGQNAKFFQYLPDGVPEK
ncbi:MAG: hypothetical protein Satyrvirus22_9 [Satyrvirus sp.]|uniref:Uncharacterized protein n=1 Tax=Satyrvirus sp. TaxID=2487771 RepID=A0A3G5AE98_9VIRU|nr:MAG: hypothetical protein Satyrvirus22_9 [Satyrvirus sp.]